MPDNVTPLPPRPTRTEAPQLTTVKPVDFNERGGPPLTTTPSTGTKPSKQDDYRIKLTPRATTPAAKEATQAPASPPSKVRESTADTKPVVAPSPGAGPFITLLILVAFVVFVINRLWAMWRKRHPSKRAKARKRIASYEGFREYRVTDVKTVAEFVAKYYRPTGRGDAYVLMLHQATLDTFGFVVISRGDSMTGEVVAFYAS